MLREYIYLDGEPLALKEYQTNPGTYYFINDHLGTPQQIVTATGTTVWQAAYLPYGQAQILTGTVTNNLRFPGQYFDAETGLHYNWHRYYDPEVGRYVSADPIGLDGGMNLYAYVQNNPVSWIDPWGLFASYIGGGGTVLVHIGPAGGSGHVGLVQGLNDGKTCVYFTGCLRVGPGMYAGGGIEAVGGGGECDSTKEQLEGTTYGAGVDYGLIESGGASGLSGNSSGAAAASGHGGAGLGFSAGADVCKTKAFCF